MKSFSIKTFCARQEIGRTHYYALEKAGLGPRTFLVGTVRRISEQAEADWVAAREAETNSIAA